MSEELIIFLGQRGTAITLRNLISNVNTAFIVKKQTKKLVYESFSEHAIPVKKLCYGSCCWHGLINKDRLVL